MKFSIEDKKAWEASAVMAELEKIALEENLLNGPPKEVFEPIKIDEEDDESWEDENDDGEIKLENSSNNLIEISAINDMKAGLKAMAGNLSKFNRIKEAYSFERTLCDIESMNNIDDMFNRMVTLSDSLKTNGYNELSNIVNKQSDTLFNRAIKNKCLGCYKEAKIEKRKNKWCVIEHHTGKTLGCHDTKEDALDQMAAIKINSTDDVYIEQK